MATTTPEQPPLAAASPPAAPASTPHRPSALVANLREAGELFDFGVAALRGVPRSGRFLTESLHQAAVIIRGTALLMLVMNMFLGITVTSFAFFVLRSLGATDFVGFFSGFLSPRMVAISMFGIVFVSKVCAGMTAEIGAMKVQQEIDALESEAVDPMGYIVATRIIGAIMFVPVGTAIALIGQFLGDYLLGVVILQAVPAELLERLQWFSQGPSDQIYALLTIFVMTVPCVIVACFYGLRTSGGPAEVGVAVSRSLLVNIPLQNIIAGTIAMAYYGQSVRIPIGG
jgi:phospholipid/cholesterol/gamma-HCH transport system permease protein